MIASWTRSIARALDARAIPLPLFFRNDEAGWADDRLLRLLPLFEDAGLPLDLAVIPATIAPRLAGQLAQRARTAGLLGLHQHGYAHENHERGIPRSEFGPARSIAAQRDDIENGRQRLMSYFGAQLDPLFTPPWNRCSSSTAPVLTQAGITGLSRDQFADPLFVRGLGECPVAIDWSSKPRGPRGLELWASRCADGITHADRPFGIQLHHLVMDDEERSILGSLLNLFRKHPKVRPIAMRDALSFARPAAPVLPFRVIDPPASALLD
jgi:hypothetical protein